MNTETLSDNQRLAIDWLKGAACTWCTPTVIVQWHPAGDCANSSVLLRLDVVHQTCCYALLGVDGAFVTQRTRRNRLLGRWWRR